VRFHGRSLGLRGFWLWVIDGLLGLMVSVVVVVQVLGSPVQVVRGGPFASVSPCGGLGSRRVIPRSHLRNVLSDSNDSIVPHLVKVNDGFRVSVFRV
jgi:hypothetical protein